MGLLIAQGFQFFKNFRLGVFFYSTGEYIEVQKKIFKKKKQNLGKKGTIAWQGSNAGAHKRAKMRIH